MKAINRLYQYIDFKSIKAIPFEKKIGLSNGYLGKQLKRNADLGESILMKIIENCPDLNPEWLLTGDGSMIKKEQSEVLTLNEPSENYGDNYKDTAQERYETIKNLNKYIKTLEDKIDALQSDKSYKTDLSSRLDRK